MTFFTKFSENFGDIKLVQFLIYDILGRYFEMILQYFGMKIK